MEATPAQVAAGKGPLQHYAVRNLHARKHRSMPEEEVAALGDDVLVVLNSAKHFESPHLVVKNFVGDMKLHANAMCAVRAEGTSGDACEAR